MLTAGNSLQLHIVRSLHQPVFPILNETRKSIRIESSLI